MRSRSNLLLAVLLLLSSGVVPAQQAATAALHIEVQDKNGVRIGDSSTAIGSSQTDSASLDFHHAYQPGDSILFTGPQEMAVRIDQTMPECLIYAPKPTSGKMRTRFHTAARSRRRAAPTLRILFPATRIA